MRTAGCCPPHRARPGNDVDIILKDKDKINFEVIHTPGHTSGGICLWDGETLISGGTIFANGGVGRMDIEAALKI